MALYCIGDVQGCNPALERLLLELDFSPSRDTVFVLGDLVNRGPDSMGVLRRLMALGPAARCLLGNHDLHLLALAAGAGKAHKLDTLGGILNAPDSALLIDWLRHQPLAVLEPAMETNGVLMVHAGVLPSWSAEQTVALAGEVHAVLRGPDWRDFLRHMYGNEPVAWHDGLRGTARLRVIVNALTRLRFCTPAGEMEFAAKEGVDDAPAGYLPWFEAPNRQTAQLTLAFGHWSALGRLNRPNLIALDTGCVWGGCLSAVKLGAAPNQREWFSVQCPPPEAPVA